jgi:hypothetical protein
VLRLVARRVVVVRDRPPSLLHRVWLADGIQVEPVPGRLGEHEDQLGASGESIGDRFGHRVRLVPRDLVSEAPAVVHERPSYPFRDHEQALVRGFRRGVDPSRDQLGPVSSAGPADACAGVGLPGVRVAEVEPQRAVLSQHPADLGEYRPHRFHELARRGLQPVLAGLAIVPKPPVGRARHDAVRGLGRHLTEGFQGVTAPKSYLVIAVVKARCHDTHSTLVS